MQITLPIPIPHNQFFRKRLLQRSSGRRLIGGVDHPADGRIRILDCCFVVDYFDIHGSTVTITLLDNDLGRAIQGMIQVMPDPSLLRFSMQTTSPVLLHEQSNHVNIELRSVALILYFIAV